MKKPGIKRKDRAFADDFNLKKIGANRIDELLARKQALEDKAKEPVVPDVSYDIPGVIQPKEDNLDVENQKSAYQMLQDMRWVYRMVDGRERLKKLVEGDDKQFVNMVRELMKIESALMSASVRKEGPQQDNRMVFVVLKGLEEEKGIRMMVDSPRELKQSLVLNPDGSDYEGG